MPFFVRFETLEGDVEGVSWVINFLLMVADKEDDKGAFSFWEVAKSSLGAVVSFLTNFIEFEACRFVLGVAWRDVFGLWFIPLNAWCHSKVLYSTFKRHVVFYVVVIYSLLAIATTASTYEDFKLPEHHINFAIFFCSC